MVEPVYYVFRGESPGVEFFALWCYVCVMEEGPEEIIFDPAESTDCKISATQLIHDMEAENQIDRSNK